MKTRAYDSMREHYYLIPRSTELECELSDLSQPLWKTLMDRPLPVGAELWDQNHIASLARHIVIYLRNKNPNGFVCDTTFLGERGMTFNDMLEYLDMVKHLRGTFEMRKEAEVVMRTIIEEIKYRDYVEEFLSQKDGPEMICGGVIYVDPGSERHSNNIARICFRFSPSWLAKLAEPECDMDDVWSKVSRGQFLPGIPLTWILPHSRNLPYDRKASPRGTKLYLLSEAKKCVGKAYDFDDSPQVREIRERFGTTAQSLAEQLSWFLKAPLCPLQDKIAMLDNAIAFADAVNKHEEAVAAKASEQSQPAFR